LEKIIRERSGHRGFILIKLAKSSDSHDSGITKTGNRRLLKNLNKDSAIMVRAAVTIYRNVKCTSNTTEKW